MPEARMSHCGEDHGAVVTRIDGIDKTLASHSTWLQKMAGTLADHCGSNALHVTRLEMNEFKATMEAKVDKVAAGVTQIAASVAEINTERKVEKAGMTRQDKWFVVLVNAFVVLAAILLKARLGG